MEELWSDQTVQETIQRDYLVSFNRVTVKLFIVFSWIKQHFIKRCSHFIQLCLYRAMLS